VWVSAVLFGWLGCAYSPPTPREDTRPLQPGAELAEEVGEATEALIEREGQDRVRYASSLDPETDGEAKPAGKKEAKPPEPAAKDAKETPPAEDAPADAPEGDGEEAAPEGDSSEPEAADAP
jgi:hypothetical protein